MINMGHFCEDGALVFLAASGDPICYDCFVLNFGVAMPSKRKSKHFVFFYRYNFHFIAILIFALID